MPEFEESTPQSNPEHSYTPSQDAKPRTRRRSGGFKKEYASAPKGNMGEIDPAEALKSEKLSGGSNSGEAQKEAAPKREKREPRGERKERAPRRERTQEPARETNPQPSETTLASIKAVEERIAQRKAERDAKHEERKKARAAEKAAKGESKKPAAKKPQAGGKKPAPKKKGLIASILSIFGLGPKEAPKKSDGKGRGGRPQGKGGNRGGQNRQGGNRGGQNRGRGGRGRGGQNRRRGQGGGQNRRPQAARSE